MKSNEQAKRESDLFCYRCNQYEKEPGENYCDVCLAEIEREKEGYCPECGGAPAATWCESCRPDHPMFH